MSDWFTQKQIYSLSLIIIGERASSKHFQAYLRDHLFDTKLIYAFSSPCEYHCRSITQKNMLRSFRRLMICLNNFPHQIYFIQYTTRTKRKEQNMERVVKNIDNAQCHEVNFLLGWKEKQKHR